MIWLHHSRIAFTSTGCVTTFHDKVTVGSHPHDTHHYHVISHRCGYGDNILAYCQEHDFAHLYLWEAFYGAPSPVLWALAHDLPSPHSAVEEIATTTFQRWLRANERPIIGGVDWDSLKADAINLLSEEKVLTRFSAYGPRTGMARVNHSTSLIATAQQTEEAPKC